MFITALLVIAKSLEATKMTFSKQMDKLIQPDKDYYSVVKRNELSSHENTQGTLNAYYCMQQTNLKRQHLV